jgi:hypothetical protein
VHARADLKLVSYLSRLKTLLSGKSALYLNYNVTIYIREKSALLARKLSLFACLSQPQALITHHKMM